MIKMIIKSLWKRRRRNTWLLLELILVTVVSWVIFDPIIVMNHDLSIPLGYDMNGLYEISLNQLSPDAKGYDEDADDDDAIVENYMRLVESVRSHPDIESATSVTGFCFPNSGGISLEIFKAIDDTLRKPPIIVYPFIPNSSYFTTYGFKNATELDAMSFQSDDIIMTEGTKNKIFEDSQLTSQNQCVSYVQYYAVKDTTYYNIRATMGDFKHNSNERIRPVVFKPILKLEYDDFDNNPYIVFRLKKGINEAAFTEEFRSWMLQNLRSGNFYARSFRSYYDRKKHIERNEGITTKYRLNTGMAIFFLVNLCLGVIGTFWIQTKTRKQEIGVMLSYGASPGYVLRLLWGEGFILTTISVFIGCILYLQYAWSEGLYRMAKIWSDYLYNYWVTDFTKHFLGVSFIVYAIILVVVLIGIFIPGYQISHIKPTDALRDE